MRLTSGPAQAKQLLVPLFLAQLEPSVWHQTPCALCQHCSPWTVALGQVRCGPCNMRQLYDHDPKMTETNLQRSCMQSELDCETRCKGYIVHTRCLACLQQRTVERQLDLPVSLLDGHRHLPARLLHIRLDGCNFSSWLCLCCSAGRVSGCFRCSHM